MVLLIQLLLSITCSRRPSRRHHARLQSSRSHRRALISPQHLELWLVHHHLRHRSRHPSSTARYPTAAHSSGLGCGGAHPSAIGERDRLPISALLCPRTFSLAAADAAREYIPSAPSARTMAGEAQEQYFTTRTRWCPSRKHLTRGLLT